MGAPQPRGLARRRKARRLSTAAPAAEWETAKMTDVRIQISEFTWFSLNSEICILTSVIFVVSRSSFALQRPRDVPRPIHARPQRSDADGRDGKGEQCSGTPPGARADGR